MVQISVERPRRPVLLYIGVYARICADVNPHWVLTKVYMHVTYVHIHSTRASAGAAGCEPNRTEPEKDMTEPTAVTETQARIATLIAAHPVVLFMKGTPARPQCGFSAVTVEVLRRHGVSLHAVDV